MEDYTELNQLLITSFESRGLKSYTVHRNPKGMSVTIRFGNGGLEKCSTETTKMVRQSDYAKRRDKKRMTEYNNSYNTRSQTKGNSLEKPRCGDSDISLSGTDQSHILSPEALFVSESTEADQENPSCLGESPVTPYVPAERPISPALSEHDLVTVELPSSPNTPPEVTAELPSSQSTTYEQHEAVSMEPSSQNITSEAVLVKPHIPKINCNTYKLRQPDIVTYPMNVKSAFQLGMSELLVVADDSQKHALQSHVLEHFDRQNHFTRRDLYCHFCKQCLDYRAFNPETNGLQPDPDPDPPYKRAYHFCERCRHYSCGTCNQSSVCWARHCGRSMTQIW